MQHSGVAATRKCLCGAIRSTSTPDGSMLACIDLCAGDCICVFVKQMVSYYKDSDHTPPERKPQLTSHGAIMHEQDMNEQRADPQIPNSHMLSSAEGSYGSIAIADDTFSLLFCNEVVFQDSPKNRIRCQLYLNSLNNVIKELLANGQLLLGA